MRENVISMGLFDSAADIKIYDYKTRSIHEEKGLLLFFKGKDIIAGIGTECTSYTLSMTDYELCIPIKLGRIEDYTACEKLFKYFKSKYVDNLDGKRRLLKRANKIALFLHEPCSLVDKKAYSDLMYSLGYGNVFIIDANTELAGMTAEEAIWALEEVHGKIDCAFEITKNDKYQYASEAYKEFVSRLDNWGYDLSIIKEFE